MGDKLAKEGGHKEVFEAEFHFEKAEAEELEFKPNVKEMLKNVKTSSSDTDEKNVPSEESESDGNETFLDNGFDQSDDDDDDDDAEKDIESTLSEVKKFESEQKPKPKKEEVKLEEDEVKMEVESESEEEEFDGSKMEPESQSSGDEELTDSFDSSAAPKQEGYVEQENMETK